ncbi:hypothetical protein FBQ96_12270, partial [Nitrospirales bacterium NOB]|nr:hypothetical protein [Nitrospirales bacterium NOB]
VSGKAAIIDLDGTLANIGHRLHHVRDGARDWDAFFEGIPEDSIVEPVRDVLVALHRDFVSIVLASGRPERCREMTVKWLSDFDVPFTELYMRPDNDTRPDHVIKSQILDGILADGYEPFVVIDDRQSVVDMWRERGLVCLQCAPSDAEVSPDALLTLMVGPSGGGKTTWLRSSEATSLGIDPSHVLSSDQFRKDLCGDFRDQTKNEKVFAAIHAVAAARLKNGLATVIDATHIRRRDRVSAAQMLGGKCQVRYIVIDRPMDEKRRDAGWRADLPIDLLAKHDQTFRSQLKEILAGDDLPNVTVHDLRQMRAAA